jgi:hypothetical protein
MAIGVGQAYPHDHSRWPSGSYTVWGPAVSGQDADRYATQTLDAWARRSFGALSPAVAARFHAAIGRGWKWDAPPPRGCQGIVAMSMAQFNYLSGLASRDPAGRQAEARERHAGLPSLPAAPGGQDVVVTAPPAPGPGPGAPSGSPEAPGTAPQPPGTAPQPPGTAPEPAQTTPGTPAAGDARAQAERALDPSSVWEGPGPSDANLPSIPARLEGPELEVPRGLGTYTIVLDYPALTGDPLMQLAYYMNPVAYHWELFDVTAIVRGGMGRGMQEEARRMAQSSQAAGAPRAPAAGALRMPTTSSPRRPSGRGRDCATRSPRPRAAAPPTWSRAPTPTS